MAYTIALVGNPSSRENLRIIAREMKKILKKKIRRSRLNEWLLSLGIRTRRDPLYSIEIITVDDAGDAMSFCRQHFPTAKDKVMFYNPEHDWSARLLSVMNAYKSLHPGAGFYDHTVSVKPDFSARLFSDGIPELLDIG